VLLVYVVYSMPKKRGKIVVRHGPMWSDKTNWLIEQYGDGRGVVAFKPSIDIRYTKKAVLRSHNGDEVEAVMVSHKKPKQLLQQVKRLKEINRVIIDETNFFTEELLEVTTTLSEQGVDVFAAGLLLDSERKDFGPTRKLMKLANKVIEGFARCDYRFGNGPCLQSAKYTFAKAKKESQLVVGAGELYGAACEEHYYLLHAKKEKEGDWLERVRHGRVKQLDDKLKQWLKTLELPYQRRPLKHRPDRWPRIEVGSDSMRVGKTTAVKVLGIEFLKMGLPIMVSLEDWRHNPHLKKSYKDSSKAIFESQKWFAKRKYEQVKHGAEGAIWIQDVHPEMDFGYALTNALMGRMKENHFKKYVDYYYSFDWGKVPAPDVLVYLTASDKVLLRRAERTLREFEQIDSDYFLLMKSVNQAWLVGANNIDIVVLTINTDDFDFATNEQVKQKLARSVLKKLKELGWNYL